MSLTLSRRAQRGPFRKFRIHGGAMLGLILGLIIGLAVALAVAMYVAKVPVPFVNSVPVRNDGQNNAEDQKNRNWNPNAALETHGPAQPASDAASAPRQPQQQPVAVPPPVEVPPSAAPDQPAANPPIQPQTRAPVNNTGPAPGDALGEFAAAHARAADNRSGNASPDAGASPFTYFVQTGAYSAPQDADAERARLSLLGMDAAITQRDQAGRVVYRVRVGPFQNKAAADQISNRLTSNGFEAALVRVPR
ncbi:MAG: SPOR domain-containing protein [Burkholderiaceae bacterium]|jgi:cell division protein FtsN|nr:SPOR domain-containing protein [Burkholderiaceae bacterium]